jgi:hypothetical protein
MPFFTAVAANPLPAATYNANVRDQVITQCTSGTRPATPVEGQHIHETDTDLLYCYNGTGWEQVGGIGGWTTFTPQIDQGATTNIAKTVNYSKWTRGPRRMITWTFDLTMTGAGTAGSVVTLTLPVAAASTSSCRGGGGYVFDTSTSTPYGGAWGAYASTTLIRFRGDWSGAGSWGSAPSIALAAGDELNGSITYEAAT